MPFIKLGLAVIILGLLVFKFLARANPTLPTLKLQLSNETFTLEMAKSALQHSRGLSFRPHLCSTCGMIFIFPNLATRHFWMKNTLLPLDMIFLNDLGVINTILTAQPQPGATDFQLKLYSSSSPSRYVIEIPAGRAAQIGLKVGATIDLSPLNL